MNKDIRGSDFYMATASGVKIEAQTTLEVTTLRGHRLAFKSGFCCEGAEDVRW